MTHKEAGRPISLQDADLIKLVRTEIAAILGGFDLSNAFVSLGLSEDEKSVLIDGIFTRALADLQAVVARDPAARGRARAIVKNNPGFLAVLHYRVANIIYHYAPCDQELRHEVASYLHSKSIAKFQIDIHPAAEIGKNFVLDHGCGTVIGETCTIGDNCYILQEVILGARTIAGNASGKRHPTLGDNVQIGGGARVFGPHTIGSNVFIAPHCVITEDIPENSRVLIVNQLQITKLSDGNDLEVYGLVPGDSGALSIHGKNLPDHVAAYLIDANGVTIQEARFDVVKSNPSVIQLRIARVPPNLTELQDRMATCRLKVADRGRNSVLISAASLSMKAVIERLTSIKDSSDGK